MTSLTRIPADKLPECLQRDFLASRYFPGLSRGMLAVVVVLCALFTLTSFHRLPLTDLWGHLSSGRWIVDHLRLPAVDPFAARPSETAVLNDAWLSEVLAYAVQRSFGSEGLALGHALLVTLTAGIVMLNVARRGVDLRLAALAGAAFFVLDLPFVGTIQPESCGQLGAALVLLACSELPHRRHPLLWLPLVGMLWANLHGSMGIGLVIVGCQLIGVTWRVLRAERKGLIATLRDSRTTVFACAAGLLLAGACLNPQGPLLFLRNLLFGNHRAFSAFVEWTPIATGSLAGVLLIGSLVAAFSLRKLGGLRFDLGELLLLAIFGMTTLLSPGMLSAWAVVWPWVLLPHAAAAWKKFLSHRDDSQFSDQPAPMRTLIAVGCIFATVIVAPPSYALLTGECRRDAELHAPVTPVHLADQARRLNLAGTTAAPLEWADYLIYQSEGKLRPLIHGQVQFLRPEMRDDYRRIFEGDERWLEVLRSHSVRYLFLSKERHQALAAKVAAAFRVGSLRIVYQDQREMILELMPAGR